MADGRPSVLPLIPHISRISIATSTLSGSSEPDDVSDRPRRRHHAPGVSSLGRSNESSPASPSDAQRVAYVWDRELERFRSRGNYSESDSIPSRNLDTLQIATLTINSMIGSGIVTSPGYVLLLTKSKTVALILWGAGGAYTLISQLLFLEYGIALSYNGGPLIYLDEVFRHPRLLFTMLFAVHRILLASTAGNSRVLAINILQLAYQHSPDTYVSEGYIKLTAIFVQSIACILLFLSRRTCFVLNAPFAVFKVGFFAIIATLGFYLPLSDNRGSKDWGIRPGYSGFGALSAMTHIIYSYQGFEDINCVAGEIKNVKKQWKRAASMAIPLVITVYMLFVASNFYVLDYAEITSNAGINDISVVFAQKLFGHNSAIKVLCSISIFANLLYEVYITARAKQAIALQRIIPFYRFFYRGGTPIDSLGGALVLHWIFSVLALVIVPTNTDARIFMAGIYSYGYQVVNLGLALGLIRLRQKMLAKDRFYKPAILQNKYVLRFVAGVFAGFNIITLVTSALEKSNGGIPRKYWPVSILGVVGIGTVYWGGFRVLNLSFTRNGPTVGKFVGFQVHYDHDSQAPQRQNRSENDDPAPEDAYDDIEWRRVTYELGPRIQAIKKWLKNLLWKIYESAYPEDLEQRQSTGQ